MTEIKNILKQLAKATSTSQIRKPQFAFVPAMSLRTVLLLWEVWNMTFQSQSV